MSDTLDSNDNSYDNEKIISQQESAQDSIMIGEIILGMSIREFANAKSLFLKENASLANIKIAKMQGYFHNNKLVRVTITSESHMNWYGGYDGSTYECSAWTDLYKRKYHEYKGDELSSEAFGTNIFSKGQCLIMVTDQDLINDVPTSWDNDLYLEDLGSNSLLSKRLEIGLKESEEALNRTPGRRFSEKRFSRIDILDRRWYLNTQNERRKLRKQTEINREKKEYELI